MNGAGGSSASLVESIPKGLEDLRGTPGVEYTEDVLVELTNAAEHTLDVTAMYWSLLADSSDDAGFTAEQLDAMGAGAGRALLEALHAAAARNVRIRILESPGFSSGDGSGPTPKSESEVLREAYPDAVTIHQVKMPAWYGGAGIMHQKIWVFDRRHIYLGSANMDWKSIMQVKEMGIAVRDCHELAADATKYFDGWFEFSAMSPASVEVRDPAVGVTRRVPPWSTLVAEDDRAPSPLDHAAFDTRFNIQCPLEIELDGEVAGVFLTGCPSEVMGPGRSYDGDGLVHTIDDARRAVCVSVMDFAPLGLYSRDGSKPSPPEGGAEIPTDTPVWWPALIDALLSATLTRKVHVRLLVSSWAHTSALVAPTLRALQQTADAGRASLYMNSGQLEIKQFVIPGWESTNGTHRRYPGHTRVNHTKYIVTDRRLNIGTSNMTWDYFSSTAGSSFNSDHSGLVHTLQSVFDRDWASPYAFRLT